MPKCKNCQQNFNVSKIEVDFIARISPVFNGKKYNIPLPEICPDCRLRCRVAHRNEQYLYQNKSAKSGQTIISLYAPDATWTKDYKLFSPEEWWQDDWDAMDYGQGFDFSQPFFPQFYELSQKVPKMSLVQSNNVNCPYTTGTGFCKNCHLINCSEYTEDSYYGKLVQSSRDIMDSDFIYNSELLYGCFNDTNCYNCVFTSYSSHCYDCYFCENLTGCKNCFLCTNLVNQEYYFLNQKVSKDEYEKKKEEFLGSYVGLQKAQEILKDLRQKRVYKYAAITKSQNSTGDFIVNCKNCTDCFDINDSEDCKYVVVGVKSKDLVDCSNMYIDLELCYQVLGTIDDYDIIFGFYIFHSQHIIYSENCWTSKYLFGCSGLRSKQYCILNKQYTEEEYNNLVPKIIDHMQKTGEWGQYFPIKYSGFGYNDTVASEYLPLIKEEALSLGYRWQDKDIKDYQPQTYVIPDKISEVGDDILSQVLVCVGCNRNYKIIKQELARLRLINLPVPHLCYDCRYKDRLKLRNTRSLYLRSCSNCNKQIHSTFAPECPEKVYCEECYQKEVY